ncbi:MAG: hypothetical protein ABIN55_03605 [Aeromicrobium sp.]
MWIFDWLHKRRSNRPAWDSLTREEQGLVMRNSQPGTYGQHERIKGEAWGPPNMGNQGGRR